MKKKILIVDDSASMRQLVSFTLTGAGYSVLAADNGKEALSIAQSADIDLLLTDLNMPELDGIGLLKSFRQMEQFKHTPVLIVTTEKKEGIKKESKAAGASGWLAKPFTPDSLLTTVKKFLR